MTNVLLQDWDTPFQIAPFDAISDEDFAPALDIALARHRDEIDAIAGADAPATFANTIEALEAVGRDLDKVLGTFYTVAGADSNPAREALQRDFSPKLAAHFAEISGNKALFARVAAVHNAREQLDLNDEQARVLMLTHRGFVRSGAALEGEDEARMKVIKGRLAELGTSFTQNLLADERDWFMELGEEDLAGLPDFVVNTARAAGEDKGADGPVVTLSRSLIVPFLQFSTRRDLREIAYKAWTSRGANGGETDNRAIAAEILALREERAKLLGYESFAAYKLETEMAKTPEAVRDLLMAVWEPARSQANADAWVLEQMMVQDGVNGPLAPWDWRFYSERRRKELHDLDEAEVKPYFQLERMIEASFACANRLFGLEFRPLDIPLYHPDCRAWEVTRGGAHVALFIGDYFARGSKRSGAWCSAMRAQAKYPEVQAPIVINVCNFAKPEAGKPALLSYDDARTLFHEFGHALHGMLANTVYPSLSGTGVFWDFVELPSQIFENWCYEKECLDLFAKHYETGELIPQDYIDKIKASSTFQEAYKTIRQLSFGFLDMGWYSLNSKEIAQQIDDPAKFEEEAMKSTELFPKVPGSMMSTQFSHIFAGGYSAGYYSYKWAEVLDADAFSLFKEKGIFNAEVAGSFKNTVLSKGGSIHPMELYKQFRGREPKVDALLERAGLTK